jgi:hypothetical protein
MLPFVSGSLRRFYQGGKISPNSIEAWMEICNPDDLRISNVF